MWFRNLGLTDDLVHVEVLADLAHGVEQLAIDAPLHSLQCVDCGKLLTHIRFTEVVPLRRMGLDHPRHHAPHFLGMESALGHTCPILRRLNARQEVRCGLYCEPLDLFDQRGALLRERNDDLGSDVVLVHMRDRDLLGMHHAQLRQLLHQIRANLIAVATAPLVEVDTSLACLHLEHGHTVTFVVRHTPLEVIDQVIEQVRLDLREVFQHVLVIHATSNLSNHAAPCALGEIVALACKECDECGAHCNVRCRLRVDGR